MSDNEPIHDCIERWHQHLNGVLPGGLDAVLHEDCVFFSPIVFTPQRGRDITKLYLNAAGSALADTDTSETVIVEGGKFRYTKEIRQGHQAMLEFETEVEGRYVNGVDIISCDDEGLIVEFKVMVRPLQAINAVHAQMKATLERMAEGPAELS